MVCPCRYFSKTLLFSVPHKEQQKTSHFKFDRTANCHHLCSWTRPFSIRDKHFMTTNTKDIEHIFVFPALFPPNPYPLKEKEGIENYYCIYASRKLHIISHHIFPQKNTDVEVSDLWGYLLQSPTQAGTS